MEKLPLISIITPVYNCEKYITETIDSILCQNMPIEHIIINDGSTDQTDKIIHRKLSDYERYGKNVRYWNRENGGEQKAVNFGLSLVSGDYFMIVNADDPLTVGAVKSLYYALERNHDALGVYPDWIIIDDKGMTVRPIKAPEWNFEYMLRGHKCIPSVGAMYRAKVIYLVGYRDPAFTWTGDFDWWYRLGLYGDMVRVPAYLANWRRHNGQMTAVDNPDRTYQRIQLIDKFFTYPGSEKYLSIKQEASAWSYIVAAVQTKPVLFKIRLLMKAIKIHPTLLLHSRFYRMLWQYADYYIKTRF